MTVVCGSHQKDFRVDQTQPLPSGQRFAPVGKVHLESGSETIITIDSEGTAGFVIVDALQLLPQSRQ